MFAAVADDHARGQAPQEIGQADRRVLDQSGQVAADDKADESGSHRHDERTGGGRAGVFREVRGFMFGVGGMVQAARQLVPPHDPFRHRAAHHAAQHQAHSGGSHRQRHHVLDIVEIGKAGGVGRARAMPAHQGDRAAQQAHQRVQVQQPGHAQPDGVLQHQEWNQGQQEGDQPGAALGQQLEVGGQADAAEEQQQQGRLDAGFERNRDAAPRRQQVGNHGEQQAAHDGVGNAVARQESDPGGQYPADDEHQAAGQ
ncbi:hypothetical protein D9M68_553540 [compost metagenome]